MIGESRPDRGDVTAAKHEDILDEKVSTLIGRRDLRVGDTALSTLLWPGTVVHTAWSGLSMVSRWTRPGRSERIISIHHVLSN